MLGVPEYADDWHPGTGHMHAIMHNDGNVVDCGDHKADVIANGSNYVEVSRNSDGAINIENTCVKNTPLRRASRFPLLHTAGVTFLSRAVFS